jgi:hypothetical protein
MITIPKTAIPLVPIISIRENPIILRAAIRLGRLSLVQDYAYDAVALKSVSAGGLMIFPVGTWRKCFIAVMFVL